MASANPATVPVGLVDALNEGRVRPGSLLLMPGFGAGLTFGATLAGRLLLLVQVDMRR